VPSGPKHPSDPSPEDLQAVRAGDHRAAARLTAAMLPRVRNLVRYLIRGDTEVEDVVQEALIAVLRGLASYRGEGTFRAWVDRVAARVTFAWLERRKLHEHKSQASFAQVSEAALASRPDEYLERRRIVEALDMLPFEQRHALVLHHVLEMSVPEIAEATRTPAETVRSRLRLGRNRMRDVLAPAATKRVS
jgi:RNA polymerase sigma-70 factor (ECF subfamily)